MPSDDADPFESTESYYAAHRPGYGDETVGHLVERFALDDSARVLDLGCGAGQVTVPLAAHAGEVIGMDPNEGMLDAARRRADAAGRENVRFVRGSDADLRNEPTGDFAPLRLTTMGRSFHWMDCGPTLDRLRDLTEPGGGVAILRDHEWLTKGRERWQAAVYEIAADFLDDLPERVDPAAVEYDQPWDELLEARGFEDVETTVVSFDREWDVEGVVGYTFSLSFCSPDRFGDEREAFESALRERLADLGGAPFVEPVEVSVLTGRV